VRKKNIVCTRSVSLQLDTAAAQSSDGRTLDGYAAVFNQPTEINSWEGRFNETISPGAFKKTLSERKPIMQFNHGRDTRVGAAPIGVFDDIKEDGHGLRTVGTLHDNDVVEPIRQGIASGAISGMSFTFNVVRDEWTDANGNPVSGRELERLLYNSGDRGPLNRNIKEVRLMEAGPVVYPAYEGTSVGVRSADEVDDEERSQILESYCRTSGLSMPSGVNEDKPDNDDEDDEDDRASVPLTDLDKDTDGDVDPVADEDMDVDPVDDEDEEDNPSRAAKTPYGDVTYADPGYQSDGKKRYPINTKEHVQAALSYISKSDNAALYTAEQLSHIKSKINAAAKKFGITVSESKSSETDAAIRTSEQDTKDSAAPSTLSNPQKNHDIARKRMYTINEMNERIAAIEVRMESLGEEYRDADMPEAEDREFGEITAERTSLLETIDKVEERLKLLKDIAKDEPKKEDRGTKRESAAVHLNGVQHDLTEIRNATYSEAGYHNSVRDNVLRFVDSKEFKPAGDRKNREDTQARVEELLDLPGRGMDGNTLSERILNTGTETYERAFFKAAKHGHLGNLEHDEFRAMQLGVDADGGYAIPVQLDPTIIWTSPGVINPIRQLARIEQIVGKEWQGVTSAGVSVSRHAEGTVTDDNSFTLAEVAVRTNRVDAFVPFTYEAEQSWQGLRNNISAAIFDGKNREEATSFLLGNGSGVAANGLLGTLNFTNSPAVPSSASNTLTSSNIYSWETALDPRWRTSEAAFLAHRSIYNLIRQFDTAGGAQLWQRIGAGLPGELLGYNAYESSVMSSAMGANNLVGIFGNFQNFLIVDRIGMQVELIPNVMDATTGRPTGQRGVFAVWMNNTKVLVDAAFKVLKSVT
jgi:HK97 family phage major capsid protein/HK97 family phage prohead protease